jgi:hypothetical protein
MSDRVLHGLPGLSRCVLGSAGIGAVGLANSLPACACASLSTMHACMHAKLGRTVCTVLFAQDADLCASWVLAAVLLLLACAGPQGSFRVVVFWLLSDELIHGEAAGM